MKKVAIHVAIAVVAFVAAYGISVGQPFTWLFSDPAAAKVLRYAVTYALIAAGYEWLFRIERSPWRFVSVPDVIRLVRSTSFTAVTFLLLVFVVDRALALPRSTLILTWGLQLGGLAGSRILWRAICDRSLASTLMPFLQARSPAEPLLVVGDARSVDAFLRGLDNALPQDHTPVGVVTLQYENVSQLRGVGVLGHGRDIVRVAQELDDRLDGKLSVLFLNDPRDCEPFDSEALGALRSLGVKLLRMPSISELSEVDGNRIRELQFEELLRRPPVELDLEGIRGLLAGKRVLVTGAGGSIGSEICRQVAAFGCGHLSLLEQSEFALFQIDRELGTTQPNVSRMPVLCDVRNKDRVLAWMKSERPDVVFHAAALKHVTMVENHPCEGVLTNVLGTSNVAEAARVCGAAHMVLISTDKAVDPSNVMGGTKRLAEAAVRAHELGSDTRFSVVRFGNVLGSAGSVVPIFQSQIERGGPVTVTDREVERFFMTIPEAVQLVLQAVTLRDQAQSISNTFVLEMGQPVRIYDLARQMIEFYGKRPDQDIRIEITGLKPGEKLTEALVDENEVVCSDVGAVMQVADRSTPFILSGPQLAKLATMAARGEALAVRNLVFDLVRMARSSADQAYVA